VIPSSQYPSNIIPSLIQDPSNLYPTLSQYYSKTYTMSFLRKLLGNASEEEMKKAEEALTEQVLQLSKRLLEDQQQQQTKITQTAIIDTFSADYLKRKREEEEEVYLATKKKQELEAKRRILTVKKKSVEETRDLEKETRQMAIDVAIAEDLCTVVCRKTKEWKLCLRPAQMRGIPHTDETKMICYNHYYELKTEKPKESPEESEDKPTTVTNTKRYKKPA